MEVELRDVWAYFEVELIKSPTTTSATAANESSAISNTEPKRPLTTSSFEELTLSNRILTDVLAGQLNMASIIVEHQRASLNLTAEQPQGIVSFERKNDPASSR